MSALGAVSHLSRYQRGTVAVELKPLYAQEAKERQREHGGTAPGKKKHSAQKKAKCSGKAAARAAKAVKVSRSTAGSESGQNRVPIGRENILMLHVRFSWFAAPKDR